MTNDEFNITRNNFTYVNDQLYTFIKTLDPAKESFFPIKNVLITLEIKLNQINQLRLWKWYLKTKDNKIYAGFRKASNQLRYLTRKYVKEKQKVISDQARINPKSFCKYVNQKRKYKVLIFVQMLYLYKKRSRRH